MNSRTVLQIPMEAALRESATVAALEQGFSSLQEAVRVILTKFANGDLKVLIKPENTSRKRTR